MKVLDTQDYLPCLKAPIGALTLTNNKSKMCDAMILPDFLLSRRSK